MNKGVIVGRLTRDIELRYTTQNKAVAEFTIACNNSKDDTTFLKISAFGKIAESTAEYCKKGDMIAVDYTVKNHNWEDKNGVKHYDYSFIANKISFLTTASKEIKKQLEEDAFQKMANKIEEEVPW